MVVIICISVSREKEKKKHYWHQGKFDSKFYMCQLKPYTESIAFDTLQLQCCSYRYWLYQWNVHWTASIRRNCMKFELNFSNSFETWTRAKKINVKSSFNDFSKNIRFVTRIETHKTKLRHTSPLYVTNFIYTHWISRKRKPKLERLIHEWEVVMNVEKGGNGNGNTNTFKFKNREISFYLCVSMGLLVFALFRQAVERDQLRWLLSIASYALYHLPAHTHTLNNNWNVSHAASHGVI